MRTLIQFTRITYLLPLLLAALLGAVLTGCGRPAAASGGSGFSSEPAAQTVRVEAHPHGALAWAATEYTAKAGDVTFVVANSSTLKHSFAVEGPGVTAQSAVFAGGTTNRYTLKGLQPGTYRLICNVPGHREGGMVATLYVR